MIVSGPAATLLAFAVFTALGAEKGLVSIDFTGQFSEIRTISGTWQRGPSGLTLAADSRVALPLPPPTAVTNAHVTLGFLTPDMARATAPESPDADHCACAVKFIVGRCLVELSDRGVSLQRLDPSRSFVDSVLFFAKRDPDPAGSETQVDFTMAGGIASVAIDGVEAAHTRAPARFFSSVEVFSYQNSFVLTRLAVASLDVDTVRVDEKQRCIELDAVYHPSQFNAGAGQPNHSFVTFECGTAAGNALFTTMASGTTVSDALEKIGATPGNNLRLFAFDRIAEPTENAPDLQAAGDRLSIEVRYEGTSFADSAIVRDQAGVPLDFRFSGNRKAYGMVASGCVVCLESCPIGVIGNAARTMRDMAKNLARFQVVSGLPFRDDDLVTLRISASNKARDRY